MPQVVHAFNCTRHEATGFSPFYLMFGCHPRLPVDIIFGLGNEEVATSPRGYAEKWAQKMKEAYRGDRIIKCQVLEERNVMTAA